MFSRFILHWFVDQAACRVSSSRHVQTRVGPLRGCRGRPIGPIQVRRIQKPAAIMQRWRDRAATTAQVSHADAYTQRSC